ncbi:hypothetical protein Sjap_005751 [Stephania japonica]|uniref:Uncharacterized protein n=1 Tax=Stephania japonica TaxID=461633 RepID=A0AAP0K672_9MAGN
MQIHPESKHPKILFDEAKILLVYTPQWGEDVEDDKRVTRGRVNTCIQVHLSKPIALVHAYRDFNMDFQMSSDYLKISVYHLVFRLEITIDFNIRSMSPSALHCGDAVERENLMASRRSIHHLFTVKVLVQSIAQFNPSSSFPSLSIAQFNPSHSFAFDPSLSTKSKVHTFCLTVKELIREFEKIGSTLVPDKD